MASAEAVAMFGLLQISERYRYAFLISFMDCSGTIAPRNEIFAELAGAVLGHRFFFCVSDTIASVRCFLAGGGLSSVANDLSFL